ncbi:galactose-1-phosphate uridylyltransferase [Pelotomaculum thermopropionicum SI]|uniref:Galactose-1-phosphate uridylyltransferase n=1 Tax=Pelotomaculum thermopropionicum (strain DSM 13744 / JCM 10971 / SI) TaxID=370438 RepID=A5D2M8_PELTS|nr:galactose-1-phosphate uridylyltransferase [Pelotomaculum thermopropionicum SI]
MSEWRKDPVVDRWVIISTERGKRPFDYKEVEEKRKIQVCPLCEGNEKLTPPEIAAYRTVGTAKDSPGWRVRVVPNKFPAVKTEGEAALRQRGVYACMSGTGVHEVIVESTVHEPGLDTQPVAQVEEVIRMWRDRLLKLRKDKRFKYIHIFKNTGQAAGASLEHVHSQLIAMPMVPAEIRLEIEGMKNYREEKGSCVMCDMIRQETAEKVRVVADGEMFLCFTPFASRFPFETWILPKEHLHDFGAIRAEQLRELASVLRDTLKMITAAVKNMPYNLILHTSPVNQDEERIYHWHIEIIPRLTVMAGFELGTGCYINPTPPEMAAQSLREARESLLPDDMGVRGGEPACLTGR